jgi:hybrid cluster-associated redox disulfide protein
MRSDQIVDDVMREVPPTIAVFLKYRMYCVGCPIAPFHSVAEACRAHGIEQELFLAALRTVASEEANPREESAG